MIGNRFLINCFIFCAFLHNAHAVELQLRITNLEGAALTQVHQGELFLVESTVLDDQGNLGEPIIMHLEKLTMVQRYPVSTHITIINGHQQIKRNYLYKVRVDTLGQYALGPAYFDLGATVVRSTALSFEVVRGSSEPTVDAADPFIFVKTDKAAVYVGEQVLLTVRLCYKKTVISLALEPLKLTNASSLQLGPVRQETFAYDASDWSCFTYTFAVYPERPGDLVIPSLLAHGERDKDAHGGFMAHFFFSFDREKIRVQSKPFVINVNHVPHAQKDNVVGEFSQFTAVLDKTVLEPGTAATYTLTLVGNGNLQLISFNELALPKSVKTYESKVNLGLDTRPGYLVRKQEIILQPLEAGIFTIPSQIFTYFDPTDKRVKRLKTKELVLSVKRGTAKKMVMVPQENEPQRSKKLPKIAHWLLAFLSIVLVMFLLGHYLFIVYEPYIDKKRAYYTFKCQVRQAKKKKSSRAIYRAWFGLLEKRLGVDLVPKSLRDVKQFFAQALQESWCMYVEKLESFAFQERELLYGLDDLIAQTYEWVSNLEDVL